MTIWEPFDKFIDKIAGKDSKADRPKGGWLRVLGWHGQLPSKFIARSVIEREGYTSDNANSLVLPPPAFENEYNKILFVRELAHKAYVVIVQRNNEIVRTIYVK